MIVLKELTIEGYKTIRRLHKFELRQINVLIGANGAGKSNLISFFKLLNAMTTSNLQTYFSVEGGGNAILHDGAETTSELVAELRFANEENMSEYYLRLLHASPDTLIFAEEKLRTTLHSNKWKSLGSSHRETRLFDTIMTDDAAKRIYTLLIECAVYQFHNTSDKARLRLKQPINDGIYLKEDAANLAPFLYDLREEQPRYYRRIVETIRQIAPFFKDFVLFPTNNTILLQWNEVGTDMLFSAHQASDGMLRTFALVTLLLQPKSRLPNLIILDEPELGLHPRAIDILAGLIHRASFNSQIILATQSPTLINYFEPDDVIVVERNERESTYNRLDSSTLQGWLEEYSLGELWQKDVTGGNPK